jgi:outer membrane protein TolC
LNDLLKARVAKSEAEQEMVKAAAGVSNARSELNVLIGRPYTADTTVRDMTAIAAGTAADLEASVAEAMARRPDIEALNRSVSAKREEERLAESNLFPRVELVAKYERDGDDPGARNNDYTNEYNASIGFQARWTFFEAGKTRALSSKARQEKRALESALKQLRDEIRLQVQQACLALEVAGKNISTASKALQQAQEHWRITDLRYRRQLATSTEVLDARTYLTRAETGYYEALYGYGVARADLSFAVGGK